MLFRSDLAMERREIDMRCGTHLKTWYALHPGWMRDKLVRVPVIIGEKRLKEFPDSPAAGEFIKDPAVRQELELMMVSQTYNRPMMAPPGTPIERVMELRKALADTFKDPEFLDELEKRTLTLDPVGGDDMAEGFKRAYAMPKHVVDSVHNMMAAAGL